MCTVMLKMYLRAIRCYLSPLHDNKLLNVMKIKRQNLVNDTIEAWFGLSFISYLDLVVSIKRNGQFRTSLYVKRDDFNFYIITSLSSNPPIAYLSHSSYNYMPGLALGQRYEKKRSKWYLRKF